MCPNIILLVPSPKVYAYDLTSCDMSCYHCHVPPHHPKSKEKSKEKKY